MAVEMRSESNVSDVVTAKIDYLQRCGAPPQASVRPYTGGDPSSRRLLQVRGITRIDTDTRQPRPGDSHSWKPSTTELITGLYGYRVPLAFSVGGSPDGIQLSVGTWAAREIPVSVQNMRIDIIGSILGGLHPGIDMAPTVAGPFTHAHGGVALGIPSPACLDDDDGAAPLDRVIRAMGASEWDLLVLAYPASETAIARHRDSILNEMRSVMTAAQNERAPSPLSERYVELLKLALDSTDEAMATGAWRTAVYLLGDAASFPRLTSAWRSMMSGAKSLPEPVRTVDIDDAAELASMWALPDAPGASSAGYYRRPFEYQSLLSTSQLAACVHLPEVETPGFTVKFGARFDIVPPATEPGTGSLNLGRVLNYQSPTAASYSIPLRSLTRHGFVAGVTGSGKTNTIFHILQQLAEASVPFLVVEPTKTEYRSLIHDPRVGEHLQVFTLGDENVAPFRLNPFEFPAGIPVGVHLDLLRSVFNVSFGMWTPLPQVLEMCLYQIYEDRGWDITANTNRRLDDNSDRSLALPTLSDLAAKVDDVVAQLGYDREVEDNIRAALGTRLNSLRVGGKGRMLDVRRSISMDLITRRPTVLELEGMGDDDDKAFVMGLIMIQLVEHLRGVGQYDGLRQLFVIEEAHRLLGAASGAASPDQMQADVRGKAVETFANLISEIRAYGQGVMVVDQVPSKLASDVVKNTNLKLVHRIVSGDDRTTLAAAMVMNETQSRALATLHRGHAAAFADGDDAPLMLQVPPAKQSVAELPGSDTVRDHMHQNADHLYTVGAGSLLHPNAFCSTTCVDASDACALARELMHDSFVQRTFSRVVLSTIEDGDALDRLWSDVTTAINARRPQYVSADQLERSIAGHLAEWFAQRRGAQESWSYTDTADYSDRLRTVLLDKLTPGDTSLTGKYRVSLQDLARRLAVRATGPYPMCDTVCGQDPPQCRYRSAVADVVASGRHQMAWHTADELDARQGRREETWQVCQDAANEIIEFPEVGAQVDDCLPIIANAKRVCLCFAQQMLAADARKSVGTSRRILDRVMAEAQL